MNDIPEPALSFIEAGTPPRRLAVRARQGASPGIFWLSGFNSDMRGTKAVALDAWAAEQGRACVRFDYSGHGRSGGAFADGTIRRWFEESLAVFDRCCEGPQIVVGSSMGGWIALLLAREIARRSRGPKLAGLVLIAPAPDFTEELMWKGFSPDIRHQIETEGRWLRPSDYGEPYPITRADRGRPQAPCSAGSDRGRLSGADSARRAGRGRALAARLRADVAAAERRRGADHDPGWRPPPVAAAGYRAADRGGGGVLING
ncbi:MAG: alpha/beta hydrolase [Xanthobacteraceae bacterium]